MGRTIQRSVHHQSLIVLNLCGILLQVALTYGDHGGEHSSLKGWGDRFVEVHGIEGLCV